MKSVVCSHTSHKWLNEVPAVPAAWGRHSSGLGSHSLKLPVFHQEGADGLHLNFLIRLLLEAQRWIRVSPSLWSAQGGLGPLQSALELSLNLIIRTPALPCITNCAVFPPSLCLFTSTKRTHCSSAPLVPQPRILRCPKGTFWGVVTWSQLSHLFLTCSSVLL